MAFSSPTQDFVVTSGLNVQGTSTVTSSTGNTSTLQVAGGAAVAKNLIVGTTSQLYGDVTAFSNLEVKGTIPYLNITGTSNLTVVSAGVVTATQLDVVTRLAVGGLSQLNNATIANGTNSTSSTTGALQVTGGVGIQKDLWVGGQAFVNGYQVLTTANIIASTLQAVTLQGSSTTVAISILNTTSSTSTNTGALQITGGAGIGGALWAGLTSYVADAQIITTATLSQFGVTSITAGTDTAINTSTGAITIWNTSTLQTITSRGNTTDRLISITNTASSTLTNTNNALYVNGGAWITKDLTVGGSIAGVTATITQVYGTSAQFFGDTNGFGALYAGITVGFTVLPSTVLQLTANIADYAQSNFQNINNSPKASTDWVLTSADGENFANFIDMAIASGTWDGSQDGSIGTAVGPNDGYLYVQGNTTNPGQGNLVIGASSTGSVVRFFAGGIGSQSIVATINAPNTTSTSTGTGAFILKGGAGISGNINVGGTITISSTASNTSTLISNALYVAGGVGIAKSLLVTGPAIFQNNVTFSGATTYVYSTNTVYTDNIIELHSPGISSSTWLVDDGTDIGFKIHYYNNGDQNAALILSNNSKYLEWFSTGVESTGTSTVFSAGNYGIFKTGGIILTNTTVSNSTTTGALIVAGGVGVGGTINATNMYSGGSLVLTTSNVNSYVTAGVSSIIAGTDTAISSSTGAVTIWNTGTLQSVTARGATTNKAISITNTTSSTSTTTGAFTVTGGAGVGGALYAGSLYDSGNRVLTSVTGYGSTYISVTNSSTGVTAVFTVTNLGVTNLTGTTYLSVSSSTGSVTLTNLGVTNLTGTTYLSVSSSTGSVTLTNLGVQTLTAGTDTSVSSSTGTVTVWNTSTLQTITSRGSSSSNAISITNSTSATSTATGALQVYGGVGIGGNLYVGGTLYATIAGNITTATNLTGGTAGQVPYQTAPGVTSFYGPGTAGNVLVSNGTNAPTYNNTLTLASIVTSTSTSTGALVVTGGVGIGGALYVGTSSYINGSLIITTATINQYASQTTITAGTDTAVNTSTGAVTIWNTGTLQSVTGRGSTTTNAISITNTASSTSTTTGALVVTGGVGIGGNLNVGGTVIGGGIRSTSSPTAPTSPAPVVGDIWYNTSTDDVYRFTSDGTSTYWLDMSGPTVSGTVRISQYVPFVYTTSSIAAAVINVNITDQYNITSLSTATTFSTTSTTNPNDGQKLMIRVLDNGTSQTLTWTTGTTNSFRIIGVTLPTNTVASKLVYVGCVYNASSSRWDVVAVGQEV